MNYHTATIDLKLVTDWPSFHDTFAAAMGFPGYYGRNMDAWIDCMSYVDEPDTGMTTVAAPPGGMLVIQLKSVSEFRDRCPEIYAALHDCAALVNWRRMENGEPPILTLAYR